MQDYFVPRGDNGWQIYFIIGAKQSYLNHDWLIIHIRAVDHYDMGLVINMYLTLLTLNEYFIYAHSCKRDPLHNKKT